jgi:uncharacterized protein (DUF1015 family)
MAEIKAFKGTVYNNEKFSSLKDVTTPPYDVITKAEQEDFYQKSDYNIIRLILGKESDLDNLSDNRYTRAAGYFKKWCDDGVLVKDDEEAIYVYQQDYHLADGTMKTRTGFIALTRIEDFSTGKILPHEKTLSGPRSDRLKLMESCHSNFSQIFSLYSDKELKVDTIINESIANMAPDIEVTDDANIAHRIYRISDKDTISGIVSLLKDKNLFIADGHHRYETALTFRDLNRKNGDLPYDSPYNYVMMYFSNMDSDGLLVFPTHRVLFNLQDSQVDFLKSEVGKFFTVIDMPYTEENEPAVFKELINRLEKEGGEKHAFGMYIKGESVYRLLVLDDKSGIAPILKDDMPESLKSLDVTVLHSVLIDHLLGVGTAAQEKQENLKYVKSAEKAVELVKSGDYQVTFLLNPTKIEQVKDVASSGNKMPQKSTFFYPKLLTGLVINRLNSK